MAISVRPATSEDRDALGDLLEHLYGRRAAHSLPVVRQESATLTAEIDGQIVGLVVLTCVDYGVEAYAAVEELVVAPAHRGAGVGRALVSRARSWAREQQCEVLFVSALDDAAAAFYRRTGFTDCTGPWLYAIPRLDPSLANTGRAAARSPHRGESSPG